MTKSPEAFRTISEVADALDVPPHVLRFWETRFTQVKPVKRGGGRRYYRPEDVRLLRGIRGLLYDDGMTIKGVQKILREKGLRHVVGLGTLASEAELTVPPEDVVPVPEVAEAAAPVVERRLQPVAPTPQADLFAVETVVVVEDVVADLVEAVGEAGEASVAHAGGEPPRRDRAALRQLVAELIALRAVMAEDPGR